MLQINIPFSLVGPLIMQYHNKLSVANNISQYEIIPTDLTSQLNRRNSNTAQNRATILPPTSFRLAVYSANILFDMFLPQQMIHLSKISK